MESAFGVVGEVRNISLTLKNIPNAEHGIGHALSVSVVKKKANTHLFMVIMLSY